jgi:hypothetical protein
MPASKVREFRGVARVAPANIEAKSTETALRSAQYELDLQLHDLRSEFIHREQKLREEYLAKVAEITGEAE